MFTFRGDLGSRLRCVLCGLVVRGEGRRATSPTCGPTGILDVVAPTERVLPQAQPGMGGVGGGIWRHRDVLPMPSHTALPTIDVGDTPTFGLPALARELGVAELWVKDEGRNPTGSLKDRASAMAVVLARAAGMTTVSCASTGNAAVSLAGLAANVGMRSIVFVPHTARAGTLARLEAFGALVLRVWGTYQQAFELSTVAAAEFGWYDRNCAVNPYLVEGKKTCGLEIAEQTRRAPPTWVSVSVGDGCTVAGIWKGLVQAAQQRPLPRLLAVQSARAAPLADAFETGTETWDASSTASGAASTAVSTTRVAASIEVPDPRNGVKALRAVRASNGVLLRVDDEEMLRAHALLGRHGVLAEPSGAAALAGLVRARAVGLVRPDDAILHVVTAAGTMDGDRPSIGGSDTRIVAPTLSSVRDALRSLAPD